MGNISGNLSSPDLEIYCFAVARCGGCSSRGKLWCGAASKQVQPWDSQDGNAVEDDCKRHSTVSHLGKHDRVLQ